MSLKIKVGFVGFGKMGSALAQGAVTAGVLRRTQVLAFDPEKVAKKKIRSLKFKLAPRVDSLVMACDVIFVCVKPQNMTLALADIRRTPEKIRQKKIFVSIAAGVPLGRLQDELGEAVPMARVMPNTPALLQCGMSAVSFGKTVRPSQKRWVTALLEAVGSVAHVKEWEMDAVTAVSGSGPAYGFYLAEAMIEAGVSLGLSKDLSRQLAHHTLYGSGAMLAKRKESADELRKQVTSPGGTTAAAIAEFDRTRLKRFIKDGIAKAEKRSKELSKIF